MIYGIGCDLVELERIEKPCSKQNFLNKIFTENELEMAKGSFEKYAGNFAVKEAVAKVFGTGFIGFEPRDIEVLRNEFGKPYVVLHGAALKLAGELKIENIYVTITNTKKYAMAVAVGESLLQK